MNDLAAKRQLARASLAAALLLLLVPARPLPAQAPGDLPGGDPPNRVARVAVLQGNVSLEPSGVDGFSQAELNYPLTAGDRIFTDIQAFAALETAGLAVRLSNGADLTVTSLTDAIAQFGLAQGSIRLRTREITQPDGQPGTVEVDTANGAILVEREGDIRIDSYPQDDSTTVTVSSGQVEVTGANFDQQLGPGQAVRLIGVNPTVVQAVQPLPADALDNFDQQQESLYANAQDIANEYVSNEMIGAADLDSYGQWSPDPEYGNVWYPTAVAVGWAPYTNGHWAWVAPWGWTWVEAEPWGFAPFHYGRWYLFNGRWGWIPGPPPTLFGFPHPVRPLYAPALVAFVGGPNVSVAAGFGAAPGTGLTAWFPLGPREPYVPWYHASPVYINRVNVTNLYNRNPGEVRNTFVTRTTVVYNTDTANITYVNRSAATVAIPQRDFAAGRPVNRSQVVRLDPNVRVQLEAAPVLAHPLVTPTAAMAAPQMPARVLPPNRARPVLETRDGLVRSNAVGNAFDNQVQRPTPQPAPAPPRYAAPNAVTPAPAVRPLTPVQPAQPQRPAQPKAEYVPNQVRPPETERPLVTRTPPQPVQPSFAEQQRAIEANEPGRPLGPQQVENLRGGRPAGPPQQPQRTERPPARPAAPAPKPAPRPAPPAAPHS